MVAMNVWPTDAADGSVANEARWRKMGRHWAPTGICPGVGGDMKPSLAGTNLTIQAGAAWVDGHFCELLGSQVLTVTANGLAVVRFDPAANTAELLYRDGVSVPAQSPTGTFEMPVALITGSVLKDRRPVAGTTAWETLTLAGSWTTVGGQYPLPRARRVGDVVQLQLAITTPTVGNMTFLSAFYTPAFAQLATAHINQSATMGLVSISNIDGTVGIVAPSTAGRWDINVQYPMS